uniref:Protein kinase domain-containing protein n=1 Tax=Fagus sylvatica TaxID=28930 RepID=A0A2N9FL53_FAGSY
MGLSHWSSAPPSSSFSMHAFNLLLWCGFLVTSVLGGNNETDRLALLEFKAKITLDPFGVMSSWNDSIHFCQWRGVTCGRRHQRVTVLDLQSLKLKLAIYTDCESCDCINNTLSGKIPSNLSACTKLQVLHFRNNLTGSIPPFFGNLSFLEEFLVAENNLGGIIPDSFGQLTKLSNFLVEENRLSGTIPPSIFNLSSLEIFGVGGNQIQGRLPSNIGPRDVAKQIIRIPASLGSCVKLGNSSHEKKPLPGDHSSIFGIIKRKKRKENSSSNSGNMLLNLSYQSLLNATDGFSSTNLIGVGSFGSVYKGILDQGRHTVAVKVLNLLRHGASKSFKAECEALRNIRHRNLVKVLTSCSGIDYQGNDFKALVMEFMGNGNLDEWLHPTPRINETLEEPRGLSLLQRLNIAIDVANALELSSSSLPNTNRSLRPQA